MMRSAIVTGAGGFIGKNLVMELSNRGVSVLALGRREIEPLFKEYPNVSCLTLDMSNIEQLKNIVVFGNYDVFYHLAWDGAVGSARSDVDLQLKNVRYTIDCIHVAKAIGCKKFVGAGSIAEKEIIAETSASKVQPGIGHVYATGKLTAHCMSKCIAGNIELDHVWGIITNTYGVGETNPRLINSCLKKIIHGEQLAFTAGTQIYDFIYISDTAKAFALLGMYGKPFCEYIIGSGKARPLHDFLLEIQSTVAPDIDFNIGKINYSGTSLPISAFNTEVLAKDTGFYPKFSFSEGILKTYQWLNEQM